MKKRRARMSDWEAVIGRPPDCGHSRGVRSRSRGMNARALPDVTLLNRRGRRECRMLAAPMARQQKKKLAADTTGSAGTIRHSLRDGFNGVLRALPGNRAFLLPSPAAFVTPARLTPASGCQDHTTSPSASAPFVRTSDRARRQSVHRSPASRVVTIAIRPSSSRRDARRIHCFLENGSKIFSRKGRTVGSTDLALNRLANFGFSGTGF